MSKCVGAFTLLEMVIALALMSLLSLLVAQWVASSQVVLRHHAQRATRLMAIYSAQGLLARDMQQAPSDRKDWLLVGDGAYVWRTANFDIGWHVEKEVLYRTQGHYDLKKKSWAKHKKNCVAVGVRQCGLTLVYKKNGTITALDGSLVAMVDGQQRTFSWYEKLRNGEVL